MIAQSCLRCGARLGKEDDPDWYFCQSCDSAKPMAFDLQPTPQLPPRCDFTWIRTFTGKKFWPLNPREEDVCIEDIAHALALRNRFSGHTRLPYSVAEHSVAISVQLRDWGYSENVQKWALLHDATEAYLPDIPTPIKPLIAGFVEIEERLMNVIANKYGLRGEIPAIVKEVDRQICKLEMQSLFSGGLVNCPRMANVPVLPGFEKDSTWGWGWETAKKELLDTYNLLFHLPF